MPYEDFNHVLRQPHDARTHTLRHNEIRDVPDRRTGTKPKPLSLLSSDLLTLHNRIRGVSRPGQVVARWSNSRWTTERLFECHGFSTKVQKALENWSNARRQR